MKHTPGPWTVGTNKSPSNVTAGKYDIQQWPTDAGLSRPVSSEENETEVANAHLIAAAPEMLEALEGIAAKMEWITEPKLRNWKDVCTRMAAEAAVAIAKAKGEN